jgi:hypothetical protein
MKKLITLIAILLITVSCDKENIQPIEKFGGSRYVVADKHFSFDNDVNLKLKNKDTIFWITVLQFDGEKIKVGDTIK